MEKKKREKKKRKKEKEKKGILTSTIYSTKRNGKIRSIVDSSGIRFPE